MKTSFRTLSRLVSLSILLLPQLAAAQVVDLDLLPWTIDSETAVFDGKTSTTIYTGLRFSQGTTSIESDEGRATNGNEQNRTLQFSGNVVIVIDNGEIRCDSADLLFNGSVLSKAIVSGAPATFELRRTTADDVTSAEAGRLNYDVRNGIIEFSDQAKITEGGNVFSSNYIVYNIVERRINADSSGSEDDRVRIIYTPTDSEEAPEEVQNP